VVHALLICGPCFTDYGSCITDALAPQPLALLADMQRIRTVEPVHEGSADSLWPEVLAKATGAATAHADSSQMRLTHRRETSAVRQASGHQGAVAAWHPRMLPQQVSQSAWWLVDHKRLWQRCGLCDT